MNTQVYNGKQGGAYFTTTATHSPGFAMLQAITDTVIASYTGNVTGLAGVTLAAGTQVYGNFTTVTLTSGSMVAYKR